MHRRQKRSRPLTPCPIVGEHSCAPLQGMSMLDPDFAALRYFFHYRFPHVRERAFASALHTSSESDNAPEISGFSGSWQRLAATSKTAYAVGHTVMPEGFRSAANIPWQRAISGLLLQQQLAMRQTASDRSMAGHGTDECDSRSGGFAWSAGRHWQPRAANRRRRGTANAQRVSQISAAMRPVTRSRRYE